MRFVLDADVVIGALDASDAHHARARALFTSWRTDDAARLISAVNLSEVLVAPASDPGRLRAAREAMAVLGVSIHQPGEVVAVEAARLRARHPISLPDAYCIATARHAGGTLVSFDQRLRRAAEAERVAAVA